MIGASDITIDPATLPALAATVVPVIDAAITTWGLTDTVREVEIVWANHGGFTQGRAVSLERIAVGYRKLGWRVTVNPRSNTSHYMIFELPG